MLTAASTTVALVMQTDRNHLKLEYKPRWWRLGGYSMNSTVPSGMQRAPANLGVNPSLTITALSEHIMSQVPGKS